MYYKSCLLKMKLMSICQMFSMNYFNSRIISYVSEQRGSIGVEPKRTPTGYDGWEKECLFCQVKMVKTYVWNKKQSKELSLLPLKGN